MGLPDDDGASNQQHDRSSGTRKLPQSIRAAYACRGVGPGVDAFEDPCLFVGPEFSNRRIVQRVAERLTDDTAFDVSGNTVLGVWRKRTHPSGLHEFG